MSVLSPCRSFASNREIAKQYLLEDWDGEESERSVAEKLGVGQKTINRARSELEDSGKLSHMTQFSKSKKQSQVRRHENRGTNTAPRSKERDTNAFDNRQSTGR